MASALAIVVAGLGVAAGLHAIARAIDRLSDRLHIINTHGLHLRTYPGKRLVISDKEG